MISQTLIRNKKNKVEAQPRKVNRVVKPVCDVDVKHSLSKANSEILWATCNKSMFDGVHDKCLLDLVQNGNKRTKSAKKHKKQNVWKPTGHVFTEVGFKNDHIARIMGYGDYQLGNIIISRVYYVEAKKVFRIYNRRTQIITKTIHVMFDEITVMASEQFSLGPGLQGMTPATSRTGLGFEESPKTPTFHDDPLNESPNEDLTSQGSSSNIRQIHTPFEHLSRWTKDHPIENVVGDPSHSVSKRKQLETDAMWCYFDAFLTSVEPKNFKQAMTEPSWIDAMQEEIHEFESVGTRFTSLHKSTRIKNKKLEKR
ncbi:hypothetical protein Tco_1480741 [Tanacetum coccineum]